MTNLTLIHTVSSLPPVFDKLIAESLPAGVSVSHMVDERLLAAAREDGHVSAQTIRRFATLAALAEEGGADLIMVTCSSIGPAVDQSHALLSIPLLRVDEPMADRAVAIGSEIGVAATLQSTLDPTVALIKRRAEAAGKLVNVTPRLAEGAFEAMVSGDVEEHDRRVRTTLRDLMGTSDVIALAQASMARVVATLDTDEVSVPVLSSPGLAVERVGAVIADLVGGG